MSDIRKYLSKNTVTLYLAPMAGFTDRAMRHLCKECGADVLVSEFVMSNAVLEADSSSRIWKILSFPENQRPMVLQLFGADPELMAMAAKRIEERLHPDFIDINYGCPAPKVVGQNAGSALLKNIPLAAQIASAVVNAVPNTPVTAKIRTGWDADNIVAIQMAKALRDAGISALAVHGRTRAQGYAGDADWNLIAEVAQSIDIPVIGNGSVNGTYSVELAKKSGVAGLMVGRAALGNPWIFQRLKCEIAGLPAPEPPSSAVRLQTMLAYARELITEGHEFTHIRPKLKPFTFEISGARKLRKAMDSVKSIEELENVVNLPHDN